MCPLPAGLAPQTSHHSTYPLPFSIAPGCWAPSGHKAFTHSAAWSPAGTTASCPPSPPGNCHVADGAPHLDQKAELRAARAATPEGHRGPLEGRDLQKGPLAACGSPVGSLVRSCKRLQGCWETSLLWAMKMLSASWPDPLTTTLGSFLFPPREQSCQQPAPVCPCQDTVSCQEPWESIPRTCGSPRGTHHHVTVTENLSRISFWEAMLRSQMDPVIEGGTEREVCGRVSGTQAGHTGQNPLVQGWGLENFLRK